MVVWGCQSHPAKVDYQSVPLGFYQPVPGDSTRRFLVGSGHGVVVSDHAVLVTQHQLRCALSMNGGPLPLSRDLVGTDLAVVAGSLPETRGSDRSQFCWSAGEYRGVIAGLPDQLLRSDLALVKLRTSKQDVEPAIDLARINSPMDRGPLIPAIDTELWVCITEGNGLQELVGGTSIRATPRRWYRGRVVAMPETPSEEQVADFRLRVQGTTGSLQRSISNFDPPVNSFALLLDRGQVRASTPLEQLGEMAGTSGAGVYLQHRLVGLVSRGVILGIDTKRGVQASDQAFIVEAIDWTLLSPTKREPTP